MKTFLLFIATLSITISLNEEDLKKAIEYTHQQKAIEEIATHLESIKEYYDTHKNYNNRFEKAKNIKLLAYSIEEEYKKAQPLIEKHYQYLKENNRYGAANDKCFKAKRGIDNLLKKLERVKFLATTIIDSNDDKDNLWGSYWFSLVEAQKELLRINNTVQNSLKKTLQLQRIDATKSVQQREKEQMRKAAGNSLDFVEPDKLGKKQNKRR